MRRNDMTAKRNCAVRSGGAFVAAGALLVAMLRNQGVSIRAVHASD